jgi:hypothetical protein
LEAGIGDGGLEVGIGDGGLNLIQEPPGNVISPTVEPDLRVKTITPKTIKISTAHNQALFLILNRYFLIIITKNTSKCKGLQLRATAHVS